MRSCYFFVYFSLAASANFHLRLSELHREVAGHMVQGEREIAIIVPTYNNARNAVCIKNIESILVQNYENFHVYIIDDCSTDGTYGLLEEYLYSSSRSDKVTLIRNKQRVGAMANFYYAIHALADHVIVINVDGDDRLAHGEVFNVINDLYADEHIWLTYGQYREFPSGRIGFCKGFPKHVIQTNAYRTYGLPISHLRTYYAWLFKLIKKEDMMYNGDFVQATCDKVLMVPMIEMSGGRFKCIEEVLYMYNAVNPLSDMRVRGMLQGAVRDRLLAMQPYKPIMSVITDFAVE